MSVVLTGNVENNETPKRKKRDLSDESSKSTNKFDQKEADKEEEKWIPDGQDGYIVESADGKTAEFIYDVIAGICRFYLVAATSTNWFFPCRNQRYIFLLDNVTSSNKEFTILILVIIETQF